MANNDHPNGQPKDASMVRMVDGYFDRLSLLKSVNASKTLAEILETALLYTDVGVTIHSDGNLHYNPIGAATAGNGKIPNVYTIHGGKSKLDLVELYSAAAQDVSIFVFKAYEGS